jgi:hypothetical protein
MQIKCDVNSNKIAYYPQSLEQNNNVILMPKILNKIFWLDMSFLIFLVAKYQKHPHSFSMYIGSLLDILKKSRNQLRDEVSCSSQNKTPVLYWAFSTFSMTVIVSSQIIQITSGH